MEVGSSDDEFSRRKSIPRTPKSSKTRSPVSRTATNPIPKETPQKQQHQSSHQQATPVSVETPTDRVSMPPRSTEVSPGPSASMNYNSRRPMPSELEDMTPTHYFHAAPTSNQYVSSTAPPYTPPPPPPRPAKVPEMEESQHMPVSPVDSINRTAFDSQEQPMANGHRHNHSYSHQDFSSSSRVPFGDTENYGQTSAKKPSRKLPNFLKA